MASTSKLHVGVKTASVGANSKTPNVKAVETDTPAPKAVERPKPTGKLDYSNAKTKDTKKKGLKAKAKEKKAKVKAKEIQQAKAEEEAKETNTEQTAEKTALTVKQEWKAEVVICSSLG